MRKPQLGKVMNRIQNTNNLDILKNSTINMFTKPKEVKDNLKDLINKEHVDSKYDELITDHHDGRIIQQYLKDARNYVKTHKTTPAQFIQDIKTRYKNQRDSSQKHLNHKYGYTFKDKPTKGFSKKLKQILEERNGILITHEALLAEKKDNYYIKVTKNQTPESEDEISASYGESVKPVKWLPNMSEMKNYIRGTNSNYDYRYKKLLNFKEHNPNDPTAKSFKELKQIQENKRNFDKEVRQTYKNTEKMSRKLDAKLDHPTKKYKDTIKKYNQIIKKGLIKAGYLKPSTNEQKLIQQVKGLKHPVKRNKYQKQGHSINVLQSHVQHHNQKLTKQQEIKYTKNQSQQIQ